MLHMAIAALSQMQGRRILMHTHSSSLKEAGSCAYGRESPARVNLRLGSCCVVGRVIGFNTVKLHVVSPLVSCPLPALAVVSM